MLPPLAAGPSPISPGAGTTPAGASAEFPRMYNIVQALKSTHFPDWASANAMMNKVMESIGLMYSGGFITTAEWLDLVSQVKELREATKAAFAGAVARPSTAIPVGNPGRTPLRGWISTYPPAPIAPKPLPVDTVWGELIAHRVWRVTAEPPSARLPSALKYLDDAQALQWRLVSAYQDTPWVPGEVLEAHALQDFDHSGGRTGIHAWKSLFEVVDYAQGLLQEQSVGGVPVAGVAIGKIRLWGDVVEHERGYRAQFARVHSIDDLVLLGSSKAAAPYHIRRYELIHKMERERSWDATALRDLQEEYFPERRARRLAAEADAKAAKPPAKPPAGKRKP